VWQVPFFSLMPSERNKIKQQVRQGYFNQKQKNNTENWTGRLAQHAGLSAPYENLFMG